MVYFTDNIEQLLLKDKIGRHHGQQGVVHYKFNDLIESNCSVYNFGFNSR